MHKQAKVDFVDCSIEKKHTITSRLFEYPPPPVLCSHILLIDISFPNPFIAKHLPLHFFFLFYISSLPDLPPLSRFFNFSVLAHLLISYPLLRKRRTMVDLVIDILDEEEADMEAH